jgi:DNA-binding NtrC family response regulator
LVASVRGKIIEEDHLNLKSQSKPETPASPAPRAGQNIFKAIEALERDMIEAALDQSGGNKQKAAQQLGLSRQGLLKKLKRLGMTESSA